MKESDTTVRAGALEDAFAHDRSHLLALSYRMTGSLEDAEEIVQETFARAIERPPPRTDQPWRPWLVRVATNLSIDALRRRKRRGYHGPWLPAPVSLDGVDEHAFPAPDGDPQTRYEQLESVSFAFLLAVDRLGPRQRAVLLLVDVFDYSMREAADVLATTEGNVRVLLHRARRSMAAYEAVRTRPSPQQCERSRTALRDFLRCVIDGDSVALEKLLTENVRTLTDGAGEFTAMGEVLEGRDRVMKLFGRVAARRAEGARLEERLVNGAPAVVVEFARSVRRQAPRILLRCDLDGAGRICELHVVLATNKLASLDRASLAGLTPQ